MTACLLVGTQFFLVLGSIWKTCARVLKMGCSLRDGGHGDVRTSHRPLQTTTEVNDSLRNIASDKQKKTLFFFYIFPSFQSSRYLELMNLPADDRVVKDRR